MGAVTLWSPSISDGTRSVVVADRTTLRIAAAVWTRRAAYAWSSSKSPEARWWWRATWSRWSTAGLWFPRPARAVVMFPPSLRCSMHRGRIR